MAIYPLFCELSSCDAAWFVNLLIIIASFIIFLPLYFLFSCTEQYSAPIQTSRSPAVGSQKIHYIHHQKWENCKMILFMYDIFLIFVSTCSWITFLQFVLFWLTRNKMYPFIFWRNLDHLINFTRSLKELYKLQFELFHRSTHTA